MKNLNRIIAIAAVLLMVSSPLAMIAEDVSAADGYITFDGEERDLVDGKIDFSSPGDRPGYTFVGWNFNNKTFKETDEITVGQLAISFPSLIGYKFTSVWEPIKYTATFMNEGTLVEERQYNFGAELGTLPTVSKAGYDFVGWSSNGEESGLLVSDVYDIPNDSTFYPLWKAKSYDVSLYDGSLLCDTIKCDYQSKYPVLPVVYKAGYVLMGWSKTPEGTMIVSGETVYDTIGNSALYSVWAPASYNVTLVDGGIDVGSYQVTYKSVLGDLPVLAKTGMTFVGWSTDGTESTLVSSETVYEQTGDSKLYAVWKANDYVATFEANGGTLSFGSKTFQYGTAIGDLPTATREGYVLKCWSLTEDGKSVIDANTLLLQDHDIKIYAMWESEHVVKSSGDSGGILDNPLAVALLGVLIFGTIGASLIIYKKGQM